MLILQETGDNSGNGTGSGVDTVANLETTVELLFHGGTDPFEGGQVGSYVQKYAPGYDLPYVFVSNGNDGFNRNVILSRYPFADLNGDTRSQISDVPFIVPDEWAPGGNGGIRGFQFAEIDLPDETYVADAVVGNAHLKSGGGSSDHNDRVRAAQNVGYYVYHLLAGAGTGTPDPNGKVADNPEATNVLPPHTAVVFGGDLNEDELRNGGTVGPAAWLVQGGGPGGANGTDYDTTDSTYDDAREFFTGDRSTQSSSKLDYLCWWDSQADEVRAFVFRSNNIPSGKFPPELNNYPTPQNPNPLLASNGASDHRPVIVDLALEVHTGTPPGDFALLAPADGATDVARESTFDWEDSTGATSYTLTVANDAALTDPVLTVPELATSEHAIVGPVLEPCTPYYWGVTAHNADGDTDSTPFAASFATEGVADFNGDGTINTIDVLDFLNAWNAEEESADVNLDGTINTLDVLFFLNAFNARC